MLTIVSYDSDAVFSMSRKADISYLPNLRKSLIIVREEELDLFTGMLAVAGIELTTKPTFISADVKGICTSEEVPLSLCYFNADVRTALSPMLLYNAHHMISVEDEKHTLLVLKKMDN